MTTQKQAATNDFLKSSPKAGNQDQANANNNGPEQGIELSPPSPPAASEPGSDAPTHQGRTRSDTNTQ